MATREADEVFCDWIRRHRGILHKVVLSFAETREDRDDLFQEILIRVWESVPKYRAESSPASWMYRTALNRAITWVRRESRSRGRFNFQIEVDSLSDSLDEGEQELLTELYSELRRLPEVNRSLILLQLDGFSYSEIADITGLTPSNVGVRISRLKQALSKRMNRDAGLR